MMFAHSSRPYLAWTRIRDSLWFLPSVGVAAGAALAVIAVQLPTPASVSSFAEVWLFGAGAAGARNMLSAIASSLITVTGVVFSVTIVALQLASSQFTPRVLGSFVANRVNQMVLAVFIGTFTYSLLVLRTIRSEADDHSSFVPHVAVTLAFVLLLVSIAALIVFINHAARSIQASVILDRERTRTLARVERLFPEQVGDPIGADAHDATDTVAPTGTSAPVTATTSGYLQAVHPDTLWEIVGPGATGSVTIRMELDVGAFAFPGKRIATVWPADAVDDRVTQRVRDAFVLGPERTIEQDVEFGLVVIADIAVRALSPGINDPTTAMQCIDRLAEILAALGTRRPPSPARLSPAGTVRLLLRHTDFSRAVGVAFDQIRLYGAENPLVVAHLYEVLIDLATIVPASLHGALYAQGDDLLRTSRRRMRDEHALEAIERLAHALRLATHGDERR